MDFILNNKDVGVGHKDEEIDQLVDMMNKKESNDNKVLQITNYT